MQLALEQICERRQLEDEMIRQVVVPLLQQTSDTVYTLLGERVTEGMLVRQSGFSDLRYKITISGHSSDSGHSSLSVLTTV